MKNKRYLLLALSFFIVLGALPLNGFAEPEELAVEESIAGEAAAEETEEPSQGDSEETVDYLTEVYQSPEEKLATMQKYYEAGGYEIWAHDITGEVGLVEKASGQILLTNPYDIGSSASAVDIKSRILSQIVIKYNDSSKEYTFNSYTQGALNNQIKVNKIRGGIRVEYTLGREEVKKLLPRVIEKTRFEEEILAKIQNERQLKRIKVYYMLKDANSPTLSQRQKDSMLLTIPITRKYAVYVIDPGIVEREMYEMEAIIQSTGYTFEMLEEDHAMVEYSGADRAPALFKLALEYYIDEDGIKVRLPASGIRYDASNYTLSSIQILPYLCAGNNHTSTGYTMIPDGSGSIVRFEDVKDKSLTITGKLYGQDFSFHNISGSNQEIMRLPAFGVVSNTGETSEGFVAYLEEGDSMAEVSTDHGGKVHRYSSVYPTFYPRPGDTYALTGISATGSAKWSVTSERKYTGNYTLRLFPLSGENASYAGMASALQGYLEKKGAISKLEEDKNGDIPLYIENFGTIKTKQKIFGIPVTIQTPLMTFQQTKGMLEELKGEGIENINVKIRGWFNGGLIHTVPSRLKVEKSIGGSAGLKDLVAHAKENGVGLYPEMEFTYVSSVGMFDGYQYKRDSVRTLDNRSARHRVYSALYQGHQFDGKLILSPAVISDFYDKVFKRYSKFSVDGLSVASLGTDLNSDHNKDYPLNREDSKALIINLLEQMKKDNGQLLVSGGNSYTWPYVDHIIDMPLDSSKNIDASESIPLMAMVLHGYKEYAGTAINLEGDFSYSLLKAVENGASPYFILSIGNLDDGEQEETDKDGQRAIKASSISELKRFEDFSKYYSIRYDIWYDDLIATYHTLNKALKDVKYSTVTGHEFLADRVVRVTYDNGVEFLLNYNNKAVTVDGETIEAISFIKK